MERQPIALETMEVEGPVSAVSAALLSRHSIREFSAEPVPEEVLSRVLGAALRAPSWKNCQPWHVHVARGAVRDHLSRRLLEAAGSGASPRPDAAWPGDYPSDMRKRMFDLGMQVYGVAGIDRKDKEARDRFMLRNFSFFDAPVALFFTTPLPPSVYVALDMGCLLMAIMLLSREAGLGTCPQAALGAYPDIVRAEFGLPEGEAVVAGMSLGFPAAGSRLNEFHTPREPLGQLVTYHGNANP